MDKQIGMIKHNRLSAFVKSLDVNPLCEEHILQAIKYGRTNFLSWMNEKYDRRLSQRFKIVKEENPFDTISVHILDYAVKYQNLKVLDWILHERPNEICTEKSALFCCVNGSVLTLKWLCANRVEFSAKNENRFKFNNSLLLHICENGNLSILKYVFENRPELKLNRKSISVKLRDEMYYYALRHNHVDVADWLHENLDAYCDYASHPPLGQYIFDAVVLNPTLEAIEWLQTNKKSDFSNSDFAMDLAASGGTIDMLEWLQTNRPEFMVCKDDTFQPVFPKKYFGCTARALVWASQNGSLENIKWLFRNSPEYNGMGNSYYGKSCLALDYARERGHVDVYDWLIENVSGMSEYVLCD